MKFSQIHGQHILSEIYNNRLYTYRNLYYKLYVYYVMEKWKIINLHKLATKATI